MPDEPIVGVGTLVNEFVDEMRNIDVVVGQARLVVVGAEGTANGIGALGAGGEAIGIGRGATGEG
ncbi:MAG: hypothetical protein JWQ71_1577 [Pedosphaera sp.]|nr:hypothetical protein [Pedosphaera sp.]